MFVLRTKLKPVWESRWSGIVLTIASAGLAIYLIVKIPPPGVSVAVMGGAAALVSLRTKVSATEKATWMILLTCFLVIEVGAIRKDRRENQEAESKRAEEQRKHFSDIAGRIATAIEQGDKHFKATLQQGNDNFDQTMQRAQNVIGLENNTLSRLTESLQTMTVFLTFAAMSTCQPGTDAMAFSQALCNGGKYPIYNITIYVLMLLN